MAGGGTQGEGGLKQILEAVHYFSNDRICSKNRGVGAQNLDRILGS